MEKLKKNQRFQVNDFMTSLTMVWSNELEWCMEKFYFLWNSVTYINSWQMQKSNVKVNG